jgi:hypothetical protein
MREWVESTGLGEQNKEIMKQRNTSSLHASPRSVTMIRDEENEGTVGRQGLLDLG